MSLVGLYRVQDAEGIGPYWRGSEAASRAGLTRHQRDNGHPGPYEDGLRGIPEAFRFGFASLTQLRAWFSATELQTLQHYGYRPVRVWVDSDVVRHGRHQAVFLHPESRTFA